MDLWCWPWRIVHTCPVVVLVTLDDRCVDCSPVLGAQGQDCGDGPGMKRTCLWVNQEGPGMCEGQCGRPRSRMDMSVDDC